MTATPFGQVKPACDRGVILPAPTKIRALQQNGPTDLVVRDDAGLDVIFCEVAVGGCQQALIRHLHNLAVNLKADIRFQSSRSIDVAVPMLDINVATVQDGCQQLCLPGFPVRAEKMHVDVVIATVSQLERYAPHVHLQQSAVFERAVRILPAAARQTMCPFFPPS